MAFPLSFNRAAPLETLLQHNDYAIGTPRGQVSLTLGTIPLKAIKEPGPFTVLEEIRWTETLASFAYFSDFRSRLPPEELFLGDYLTEGIHIDIGSAEAATIYAPACMERELLTPVYDLGRKERTQRQKTLAALFEKFDVVGGCIDHAEPLIATKPDGTPTVPYYLLLDTPLGIFYNPGIVEWGLSGKRIPFCGVKYLDILWQPLENNANVDLGKESILALSHAEITKSSFILARVSVENSLPARDYFSECG